MPWWSASALTITKTILLGKYKTAEFYIKIESRLSTKIENYNKVTTNRLGVEKSSLVLRPKLQRVWHSWRSKVGILWMVGSVYRVLGVDNYFHPCGWLAGRKNWLLGQDWSDFSITLMERAWNDKMPKWCFRWRPNWGKIYWHLHHGVIEDVIGM